VSRRGKQTLATFQLYPDVPIFERRSKQTARKPSKLIHMHVLRGLRRNFDHERKFRIDSASCCLASRASPFTRVLFALPQCVLLRFLSCLSASLFACLFLGLPNCQGRGQDRPASWPSLPACSPVYVSVCRGRHKQTRRSKYFLPPWRRLRLVVVACSTFEFPYPADHSCNSRDR
jgi:hypothetical protein